MTEISPFVYGQVAIQIMRSGTPELGMRLQDNNAELKPGYWELQQSHQKADAGLPTSEVPDSFL
jgi:hypothetical protein